MINYIPTMEDFRQFGIVIPKKNIGEAALYGTACIYILMEKILVDFLRPFRISTAKFNALLIIKHIGGSEGLSQRQIGKRLIVTASNMTRLLDRLEKDGYIERLGQKDDRRINRVRITRKGTDLLDTVWPGYYETVQRITGLLNKEELSQITHVVEKWIHKLGEVNIQ